MPDPIIGRRLFTDGEERVIYHDPLAGSQYVIDDDGRRVYGVWVEEDNDAAPVFAWCR